LCNNALACFISTYLADQFCCSHTVTLFKMSLGPILALQAAYIVGFVLPPLGLAPDVAGDALKQYKVPVGAALKALPVLALGLITLGKASSTATKTAGTFARYMGFGLVLGAVGDVFLDMSQLRPNAFQLGLVAFLLGHIWYCVAFLQHGVSISAAKVVACAAVPAALLYILWPTLPADLVGPVVVYAVVIATMALLSMSRPAGAGSGVSTRSWWLAVIGAAVFVCSDSILAVDKFRAPLPLGKLWVMLTYYAAQVLSASSAWALVHADVQTARAAARKDSPAQPAAAPSALSDAAATGLAAEAPAPPSSGGARKRKAAAGR
jgi:uncharacterized membrane protein YhhN